MWNWVKLIFSPICYWRKPVSVGGQSLFCSQLLCQLPTISSGIENQKRRKCSTKFNKANNNLNNRYIRIWKEDLIFVSWGVAGDVETDKQEKQAKGGKGWGWVGEKGVGIRASCAIVISMCLHDNETLYHCVFCVAQYRVAQYSPAFPLF